MSVFECYLTVSRSSSKSFERRQNLKTPIVIKKQQHCILLFFDGWNYLKAIHSALHASRNFSACSVGRKRQRHHPVLWPSETIYYCQPDYINSILKDKSFPLQTFSSLTCCCVDKSKTSSENNPPHLAPVTCRHKKSILAKIQQWTNLSPHCWGLPRQKVLNLQNHTGARLILGINDLVTISQLYFSLVCHLMHAGMCFLIKVQSFQRNISDYFIMGVHSNWYPSLNLLLEKSIALQIDINLLLS